MLKVMNLLAAFVSILVIFSSNVFANSEESFSMSNSKIQNEQFSSHDASWKKVGEAEFHVFLFHIYDAELFSANGRYEKSQFPIKLKLTYQRSISKEDLLDATKKQWKKQKLCINNECDVWLEKLGEFWPDVNDGDSITLTVDQSGNSKFLFNDELVGEIESPLFSEKFSAIWLAENNGHRRFQQRLTGQR